MALPARSGASGGSKYRHLEMQVEARSLPFPEEIGGKPVGFFRGKIEAARGSVRPAWLTRMAGPDRTDSAGDSIPRAPPVMTIRTLVVSLILAAPSLARDVTVRLLAERAIGDLGEIALVADTKRTEPIPLPLNAPSEPLVAPARAFEVKAGETSLAKVTLPAQGNSFLVLLLPAENAYQPVVLAADGKAFKGGDVYFHNSTAKAIAGNVGTASFTLEPGKGSVVTPAGALPEKLYDVVFKVREEKGERVLSETRWPVDAQFRTYVFFFTKPGTERVDYRAVEEFVAVPAAR